MKAYTMTSDKLDEYANQVKEIFLEKLKVEGLIDEDKLQELNHYCIHNVEKSQLGQFWNKILFNNDNEMKITVVKVIK